MLDDERLNQFHTREYLVVEDMLYPDFPARIKAEHEVLPDRLYDGWYAYRAMREETRAYPATRSHTPIHRCQSDAPFCA